MSYEALINKNISFAFKMVKDLAIDAVITRNTNINFDFSTGGTSTPTTTTINIKVIIISDEKLSKDRNTISQELLFKANEVVDVTSNDTITINGISWKIENVMRSDKFVKYLTVFREV